MAVRVVLPTPPFPRADSGSCGSSGCSTARARGGVQAKPSGQVAWAWIDADHAIRTRRPPRSGRRRDQLGPLATARAIRSCQPRAAPEQRSGRCHPQGSRRGQMPATGPRQARVPRRALGPRARMSHHRAPSRRSLHLRGDRPRAQCCRDEMDRAGSGGDYWLWRWFCRREDKAVALRGLSLRICILRWRWTPRKGPPPPPGFSISAFHADQVQALAAQPVPQGLQLGKGEPPVGLAHARSQRPRRGGSASLQGGLRLRAVGCGQPASAARRSTSRCPAAEGRTLEHRALHSLIGAPEQWQDG